MRPLYTARLARAEDVPAFIGYLADHVSDNGVGDTPLFIPQARGEKLRPETLQRFRNGLTLPVGRPGWVRAWLAFDEQAVVGHCDLSAAQSPHASHRAMLGMGVDREHRRRGLGRRLMELAVEWARSDPRLRWIDLDVLGHNEAARSLYEDSGFELIATLRDAFVIDGESIDRTMMTRKVEP